MSARLEAALRRILASHDAHDTMHASDGDDVSRMIEWADAEDEARAALAEADEQPSIFPESHPPPHATYLLERNGVKFTATPCYGMHAPWWVTKTLTGEAAPEPMQDGDKWWPA